MAPQHVDAFGRHRNPDPFGERRKLTSRARSFAATLKRSDKVQWAGAALMLALWVGLIVLSFVTGEGAGPG